VARRIYFTVRKYVGEESETTAVSFMEIPCINDIKP
jgi:hypothetical protein